MKIGERKTAEKFTFTGIGVSNGTPPRFVNLKGEFELTDAS
jgi:hypothetical protein